MVFNDRELRKIIQASISIDMKIGLIEQLHHQDVQTNVSEAQQSLLKAMEKTLRDEKEKGKSILTSTGYIDQLLPDALVLAKEQQLTIPYLQRTFKIGYNRAKRLLIQCDRILNEEE